jgi:hypothetical protein
MAAIRARDKDSSSSSSSSSLVVSHSSIDSCTIHRLSRPFRHPSCDRHPSILRDLLLCSSSQRVNARTTGSERWASNHDGLPTTHLAGVRTPPLPQYLLPRRNQAIAAVAAVPAAALAKPVPVPVPAPAAHDPNERARVGNTTSTATTGKTRSTSKSTPSTSCRTACSAPTST